MTGSKARLGENVARSSTTLAISHTTRTSTIPPSGRLSITQRPNTCQPAFSHLGSTTKSSKTSTDYRIQMKPNFPRSTTNLQGLYGAKRSGNADRSGTVSFSPSEIIPTEFLWTDQGEASELALSQLEKKIKTWHLSTAVDKDKKVIVPAIVQLRRLYLQVEIIT